MARRVNATLGAVSDRYPWLGPIIFVSSSLYFFAQIAVAWVFHPAYSVIDNSISDLGNTTCGLYGGNEVCSPRHVLMNVAFVFLGLVMASGSMLLYQEFAGRQRAERLAARVGFGCMAIGGAGTVLVGVFPENTSHVMHVTGAALAIGVGNLGIFVLGAVLRLPESMRRYMLVFSTVSVTALFLFASHKSFGIGPGTTERIAAYPETVWLISFGLYVWRFHPKNEPVVAAGA
jgi:hypothetical membrane protein